MSSFLSGRLGPIGSKNIIYQTRKPHVLRCASRRSYGSNTGSNSPFFLTPRNVVGSIVAICTGVCFYRNIVIDAVPMKGGLVVDAANRIKLNSFNKNMIRSRRNIQEGRWWVVMTSTLTHIEWWHLGMNMWALWGLGQMVVARYGTGIFGLLWVGAGTTGYAIQTYWPQTMSRAMNTGLIKQPGSVQPDRPTVGASGSICGMIGALTCTYPKVYGPSALILVAGSIICLQADLLPTIGHIDHLGGMAYGAAFWLCFLRRKRFAY